MLCLPKPAAFDSSRISVVAEIAVAGPRKLIEFGRMSDARMRWFARFELVQRMARAGFSRVEVYGDFDGSTFDRASPAIIIVAAP